MIIALPDRPLVVVFFAAVPGTTILETSARRTATGTTQTTGTTTTASGLPVRSSPELQGLRSLRACAFSSRAAHDEHGRGKWFAPDTAMAPVLAHLEGRQGPWFFLEGNMADHARRTGPALEAHFQLHAMAHRDGGEVSAPRRNSCLATEYKRPPWTCSKR